MWGESRARLKRTTALAFRAAYMFRPGAIEPLHGHNPGLRCTPALHRDKAAAADSSLGFPKFHFDTEQIARAMLAVAQNGAPKRILEIKDIRALALARDKADP